MTASALKPCPFCGSRQVRVVEIVDGEGDRACAVGCEGCGCNGAPHIPLMDDARPAAIASWDRREEPLPWQPIAESSQPASALGQAHGYLGRVLPYLRDQAGYFDDDGSNEPLELLREIEAFMASPVPDESAKVSAKLAFDGTGEAPPAAPVGAFVWKPIAEAPQDGTRLMLWDSVSKRPVFGSWRGDNPAITHYAAEPAGPEVA